MFVAGLWVLKRTGKPFGAFWWGKISTIIYYIAITILVLGGHTLSPTVILLTVWIPFAALFSVGIEYLQWITAAGIADVDDSILNFIGAAGGYIITRLCQMMYFMIKNWQMKGKQGF